MLLYYAIICYYLRSSIIFCLSFGDIHIYLGISLSRSFLTVSKVYCGKVLETFVIVSATLLRVKSSGVSGVSLIALF